MAEEIKKLFDKMLERLYEQRKEIDQKIKITSKILKENENAEKTKA